VFRARRSPVLQIGEILAGASFLRDHSGLSRGFRRIRSRAVETFPRRSPKITTTVPAETPSADPGGQYCVAPRQARKPIKNKPPRDERDGSVIPMAGGGGGGRGREGGSSATGRASLFVCGVPAGAARSRMGCQPASGRRPARLIAGFVATCKQRARNIEGEASS